MHVQTQEGGGFVTISGMSRRLARRSRGGIDRLNPSINQSKGELLKGGPLKNERDSPMSSPYFYWKFLQPKKGGKNPQSEPPPILNVLYTYDDVGISPQNDNTLRIKKGKHQWSQWSVWKNPRRVRHTRNRVKGKTWNLLRRWRRRSWTNERGVLELCVYYSTWWSR